MNMQIEWAIKTKLPNDQRDYRVLASSKGLIKEKVFEDLFRKWQSGEMPLKDNDFDPGAPWLTFAPLKSNEDYYYLLLRERWTDISDIRNRRIKISECLIFSFKDIASVKMSLHDLVSLLENPILVSAAFHLSQGRIPEETPPILFDDFQNNNYSTQILGMIDRVGFARCRNLASLLTNQPLALLIPPGAMTWQDRLEAFDAILGLLPYGVRAKIPLSTWVQGGFMENFRLIFCRSSSEERSNYIWKDAISEEFSLDNEQAIKYADGLNILERHRGLRNVIGHLSDQVNIISLDANTIQNELESFSPAIILYEKAAGCLPRCRDAIRRLFFSEAINDLNENQKVELLTFLIQDLSQEDIQIFESYEWNEHFYQPVSSELERALEEYTDEQEHFNAVFELVIRKGQLSSLFDELMKIIIGERKQVVMESREENFFRMIVSALEVEQRLGTEAVSQWLLKTDLSDSFFYDWAVYLYDQDKVGYGLFQERLKQERRQELLPLQIVWGISDQKFTQEMLINVVNLNKRYLGYLFRKAIDKEALNYIITLIVEWLLTRENLYVSDQMMSNINKAANQTLSVDCWAALDVIRLAFLDNIDLLNVNEALIKIDEKDFNVYLSTFVELSNLRERQSLILRNLGTYYHKSLSTKIQNNHRGFDRLNRLIQLLGGRSFLDNLTAHQALAYLRKLLDRHATIEELVPYCIQIITYTASMNKEDDNLMMRELNSSVEGIIRLFSETRYPNTFTLYKDLIHLLFTELPFYQALMFERVLSIAVLDEKYLAQDKGLWMPPRKLLITKETELFRKWVSYRIRNRLWYIEGVATYFRPDEISVSNDGFIAKISKLLGMNSSK